MATGESAKKAGNAHAPMFSWAVDYVAAEQNLETIGYFAGRYARKRPAGESERSRFVSLSDHRRLEIIPSAKYGFPNAEDLDYYRAFLKICEEQAQWIRFEDKGFVWYHPQLPSPIAFSSRDLILKAGRHKSQRELRTVRAWIERLSATQIRGELFDAREDQFTVRIGYEPLFRQFVHVGRLMSDGTRAAQNYVWLAQWFLDNYFHFYTRPVDLEFHHRLTHAIAKTLYPLLDNGWYASKGAPYTKSYATLCSVLDIKRHTQLSRVRHQLDASNEELVRERFVSHYEYRLRPDGEWSGNVRWWPGPKWAYDQEQKHRGQTREIYEATSVLPQAPSPAQGEREAAPQPLLPVPPRRKTSQVDPAVEARVRTFYQELGQSRSSREQLKAGVAILQNLQQQGYSWEDVDFTLRWMIANREHHFDGSIRSIGVIPYIIGEALMEKSSVERKQREQQAAAEKTRQDEQREACRKLVEEQLASLSATEHERLHQEAKESLVKQGVTAPYIREIAIKEEMMHLFAKRPR